MLCGQTLPSSWKRWRCGTSKEEDASPIRAWRTEGVCLQESGGPGVLCFLPKPTDNLQDAAWEPALLLSPASRGSRNGDARTLKAGGQWAMLGPSPAVLTLLGRLKYQARRQWCPCCHLLVKTFYHNRSKVTSCDASMHPLLSWIKFALNNHVPVSNLALFYNFSRLFIC